MRRSEVKKIWAFGRWRLEVRGLRLEAGNREDEKIKMGWLDD